MDDALFVGGGETVGDLQGVVDGLAERDRRFREAGAEGLAFEQFGDDVGRAVGFADVEDGKNVGMVQGSGGAGFLGETLQAVLVSGERGGQNLDGDGAVEAGVAGAIDFAHSAGSDGRKDFVGTETASSGEGHKRLDDSTLTLRGG